VKEKHKKVLKKTGKVALYGLGAISTLGIAYLLAKKTLDVIVKTMEPKKTPDPSKDDDIF
jgi:hypothetical protein